MEFFHGSAPRPRNHCPIPIHSSTCSNEPFCEAMHSDMGRLRRTREVVRLGPHPFATRKDAPSARMAVLASRNRLDNI